VTLNYLLLASVASEESQNKPQGNSRPSRHQNGLQRMPVNLVFGAIDDMVHRASDAVLEIGGSGPQGLVGRGYFSHDFLLFAAWNGLGVPRSSLKLRREFKRRNVWPTFQATRAAVSFGHRRAAMMYPESGASRTTQQTGLSCRAVQSAPFNPSVRLQTQQT